MRAGLAAYSFSLQAQCVIFEAFLKFPVRKTFSAELIV